MLPATHKFLIKIYILEYLFIYVEKIFLGTNSQTTILEEPLVATPEPDIPESNVHQQQLLKNEELRKQEEQLLRQQQIKKEEQEKLVKLQQEQERLLRQQQEQEQLRKQQEEQERLLRLQQEQEQLRKQQEEQEKLFRQQQEQERLLRQQQEQEQLRKQQEEQEKLFRQQQEQEQLRKQQEEQERLLRQQQEQEKLRKQQEEQERLFRQQQEQEKLFRQQQEEQERLFRQQQEQEKLFRQQKEQFVRQEQEQQLFRQEQNFQHQQQEFVHQTRSHHQQTSELHHSELSMQIKTGGLVYRKEVNEAQIEDYVGSLRPTTTGAIIRTEGDVLYTQAPSFDDQYDQESHFSEVNLRKTSTTGKKDIRQSGVFVGIFGENNALVNSSEAFDYEKHSVKSLVDHFSKTKPKDVSSPMVLQQASQAPPLSYLREQAKERQFHYQEKGKVSEDSSENKKEDKSLQEMMARRRNSLKDYLLMEFSEGHSESSAQSAYQLLDPSAILKGGKHIAPNNVDTIPPPKFSLRSQSASPSTMMLKSNIKPPTPKPYGQPRRLIKPEARKPLNPVSQIPPSPPPVQPKIFDLSNQCIHDEQITPNHLTLQQIQKQQEGERHVEEQKIFYEERLRKEWDLEQQVTIEKQHVGQQKAESEQNLSVSSSANYEQESLLNEDENISHYTAEAKMVCKSFDLPINAGSSYEYHKQTQDDVIDKRATLLVTPGSRPSSKMSIEQMMEELNEPLPPMQPLPSELLTNFHQLSTFQSNNSFPSHSPLEWQPQAIGFTSSMTTNKVSASSTFETFSAEHKSISCDASSSSQPVSFQREKTNQKNLY